MASVIGVTTETYSMPQDDQSWLVNRITDGVQSVQLDVNTFLTEGKTEDYFASLEDDDTIGYVKSGIPLALITTGDSQGMLGPYDPAATDGRNGPIEGLLESQFAVEFTRSGVKERYVSAGMRYMAVINKENLPYDVGDATWHGMFYDNQNVTTGGTLTPITMLSAASASNGATELADASVTTAKIADKAVTAGKIADGVIPTVPATPTWGTLGGKPDAATIADLTAAPDAAAFNKVLAALRTWGLLTK